MRSTIPKIRRCSPEIPNIDYVYSLVFSLSIAVLGSGPCLADDLKPLGFNTYQIVTGDNSEEDRRRWDKFFSTQVYVYGKDPAPFLQENVHRLPKGRALDIATGEGRNAAFLATRGFSVDGVDISDVALRKAKRLAKERGVVINPIIADLTRYSIKPNTYTAILSFDYFQKSLIPEIKRGLKKGGVVIYENYTIEQLDNYYGRTVPRDHLLKKGELREFFKDFDILIYSESNDGKDAKVKLAARKP